MQQNEARNITDLKNLLLGVGPSSEYEDRWVWLPDSTRGFSVKSCYQWLCARLTSSQGIVDEEKIEACKNYGEMTSHRRQQFYLEAYLGQITKSGCVI